MEVIHVDFAGNKDHAIVQFDYNGNDKWQLIPRNKLLFYYEGKKASYYLIIYMFTSSLNPNCKLA